MSLLRGLGRTLGEVQHLRAMQAGPPLPVTAPAPPPPPPAPAASAQPTPAPEGRFSQPRPPEEGDAPLAVILPPEPPPTIRAPGLTTADDYVLRLIDAHNRKLETSRDGGTNGFMHVSSLIGLACQRKSALMAQHHVVAHETVTGAHRIMWAQGRATEAHIREAVIGATGGAIVYGLWECRCGYAQHLGMRPAQDFKCRKCEHALTVYKEPVQFDTDAMLTGSPDMTLVPMTKKLVVEIKSMTPDDFDALEAPVPDHANQALMYREMYRRSGHDVMDEVVILYGRKQFRWGGALGRNVVYKEFHVDATTRIAQDMVAMCYDIAYRLAAHYRAGTLPARTCCAGPEDKTATQCPVAHLCFNMRSDP